MLKAFFAFVASLMIGILLMVIGAVFFFVIQFLLLKK